MNGKFLELVKWIVANKDAIIELIELWKAIVGAFNPTSEGDVITMTADQVEALADTPEKKELVEYLNGNPQDAEALVEVMKKLAE
jgi:hypothetical protein